MFLLLMDGQAGKSGNRTAPATKTVWLRIPQTPTAGMMTIATTCFKLYAKDKGSSLRHFIIIQPIYEKNVTTMFQNLMILVYVIQE